MKAKKTKRKVMKMRNLTQVLDLQHQKQLQLQNMILKLNV